VRRTVRAAAELGIGYLTLFGFSSENWARPEREIEDLMGLLRLYLRSETAELHKNNVRIRIIGDRSRLARDIVQLIEQAENTTSGNTGLTAVLALSYGGRQDITQAAQALAREAAAGRLDPATIDEAVFGSHLATAGIPDPDLLIRTSGEQRISNFLIWQLAYTEFVFQDVLWPDFDACNLAAAVDEFRRRDRRYGATVSSS
jgi:undecaprenyl diphosphate synthase